MRCIKVPKAIQIMRNGKPWVNENETIETPWAFHHYLETIVLQDPAMGSGYEAWKAYADLTEAFSTAGAGTIVSIDEAHWKLLCTVINNPKGGLPSGAVMHQVLPFMNVILNDPD